MVFSFFFGSFFFLWKAVETVEIGGSWGLVSVAVRGELEDAVELELDSLREGEGVQGLAESLEFRDPGGVDGGRRAGAETLEGGLGRLVATPQAGADADLRLQFDRGQEEVLEEA